MTDGPRRAYCPNCGSKLTEENLALVDYSGGKQDGGPEEWCSDCLEADLFGEGGGS